MLVWLSKIVLALHFCTLCWRWSKTFDEIRCNNMIWLLIPVFDSPIVIIGPVGLLSVVSHLFAVAILVLWVELERNKKLTLDVRNIFAPLALLLLGIPILIFCILGLVDECCFQSWRSAVHIPKRIMKDLELQQDCVRLNFSPHFSVVASSPNKVWQIVSLSA